MILGSETEVACYATVKAVAGCWESQVCLISWRHVILKLHFALWDTPLAFIALVFSKHGHKVDICKDCAYHMVAGRLEKHVCTENIEGPLQMPPNEKHKELRSGKDCNKWRKGYVTYADFESTLEPERCPVPLHSGSMVACKPAVAFT